MMMDGGAPVCGLDVSLAVVGGKWKPLILYHLQSGPRRFAEVKRLVGGISEKVLIQQLRELVAVGVLVRRDHQRVPPMVDYSLTPLGTTLVHALMPLCEWGTEHRRQVTEAMHAVSAPVGTAGNNAVPATPMA
ncbi:winged helix-turn-helix transcriptional regulator [uncultured Sphingomonas sp.]|uniref:winged helix-turn-helix transcriptional regulator n=1 Tax=uncultured Sphingomonas sp. TaxID=158754 RepID=UPI0035CC21B0